MIRAKFGTVKRDFQVVQMREQFRTAIIWQDECKLAINIYVDQFPNLARCLFCHESNRVFRRSREAPPKRTIGSVHSLRDLNPVTSPAGHVASTSKHNMTGSGDWCKLAGAVEVCDKQPPAGTPNKSVVRKLSVGLSRLVHG